MYLKFKPSGAGADIAEVDVTSFMNLMVVLVPVLLITLTFTQVSVLDLHLPELTGGAGVSEDSQSQLVVKIHQNGFKVYYPENTLIQDVPLIEDGEETIHDYRRLSLVMQSVKEQLSDKRNILLLAEPNVDYQNLVSTMDTVKSYKAVLAASVVEVELFPEISLGDAK